MQMERKPIFFPPDVEKRAVCSLVEVILYNTDLGRQHQVFDGLGVLQKLDFLNHVDIFSEDH